MSGMLGVVSYGLGTIIGVALIAFLVIIFIQDITQKKHTVLRNYPVIGRLRYFFEKQGEYFRQYFFMNDREELPFNRATRGWVYRLAKAEGGVIGFGSTNNTNEPGSILFVNHPYPVLEEDRLPTPPKCWASSNRCVSRSLGFRLHQQLVGLLLKRHKAFSPMI